jgi:hypothetical protein
LVPPEFEEGEELERSDEIEFLTLIQMEDFMEQDGKGNGAADSDGFDWSTGEQGTSKYARPVTLPENPEVEVGKYAKTSSEFEIKPVKRLGSIQCRKSRPQEWFRAHPAMFTEVFVIKKDSTGDFYVVDLELVPELSKEMRPAYLAACISDEGALFLWPILKPKGDGGGQQLFENDLADLGLSRTTWIRREWDPGAKGYRVDEANSQKLPEWPENQNILDWVNRAFKGRFIDDLDHPLLRRLRGEL